MEGRRRGRIRGGLKGGVWAVKLDEEERRLITIISDVIFRADFGIFMADFEFLGLTNPKLSDNLSLTRSEIFEHWWHACTKGRENEVIDEVKKCYGNEKW
jgi:hypothetical protein